MGSIRDEVLSGHLANYPQEIPVARLFTNGFDVNWARRRRAHNTELSCYILGPEKFMKETFGFEFEVAMFISDYSDTQPRTIQAVNQIIFDDPFHGRIDNSIFIIVSRDERIEDWVADYSAVSPIPRTPVGIHEGTILKTGSGDAWAIRNALSRYLFQQDLFDNRLPLSSDLYFFGRKKDVHAVAESIRRAENRGVFGLRKTGKTSLLFKVARHCEENGIADIIYVDCKDPPVRSQHWEDLIKEIGDQICAKHNLKRPTTRGRAIAFDSATVA